MKRALGVLWVTGLLLARSADGEAASFTIGPQGGCDIPADLAFAPDVAALEAHDADLAAGGFSYELPGKLTLRLEKRLPPPAPQGTDLLLGAAMIDTKSGEVLLEGAGWTGSQAGASCDPLP